MAFTLYRARKFGVTIANEHLAALVLLISLTSAKVSYFDGMQSTEKAMREAYSYMSTESQRLRNEAAHKICNFC